MATKIARGEVWIVDLGMVAKIRSCLVLSIPSDDENDRVLTTIVPHTTSTRQSRFEIIVRTPFLKEGAFDTQNILTIPSVKLVRRLGTLNADQLSDVEHSVKHWLGFDRRSAADTGVDV
jgi:mRNA interferase MazF